MNETAPSSNATAERVECTATKEPSVRIFIMAAMCIGFGVYCYYDAFISRTYVASSPMNQTFNEVCGYLLPPLGLIPLFRGIWLLRRKFVADAEGLGWVGRDKVAWSNVRRLVVRGKELFDVHYEVDSEAGVLHLDAWKMKNFPELVKLIEAKTPGIQTEVEKK